MWVRNETRDCPENGEGLDLEVGRSGFDGRFIEGDIGVVLLIDVKVFD